MDQVYPDAARKGVTVLRQTAAQTLSEVKSAWGLIILNNEYPIDYKSHKNYSF